MDTAPPKIALLLDKYDWFKIGLDENGNLVDKDGNPVTVVPGTADDHDGWDQLSEEQRELEKWIWNTWSGSL